MSQDGSGNQPTRAKIANMTLSEKTPFDFFGRNLGHQAPWMCFNSDQKVSKTLAELRIKLFEQETALGYVFSPILSRHILKKVPQTFKNCSPAPVLVSQT